MMAKIPTMMLAMMRYANFEEYKNTALCKSERGLMFAITDVLKGEREPIATQLPHQNQLSHLLSLIRVLSKINDIRGLREKKKGLCFYYDEKFIIIDVRMDRSLCWN